MDHSEIFSAGFVIFAILLLAIGLTVHEFHKMDDD